MFSYKRIEPTNVLATRIGYPLVTVGGKRQLSEIYFDSAKQCEAGIVAFYDLLLIGGEPYADWS